MKVSVVQFRPKLLAVKENLDRLLSMLESVESDMFVLPELVTSGYVFATMEEVAEVAESIPGGSAFKTFSSLSKRKNCSIVYGFPEKADLQANFGRTQCAPTTQQPSLLPTLQPSNLPTFYNSCALINPDGSYYIYRKIHLFNREKLFFSPGEEPFKVHSAKGGVKIGMMICFDWQFPEATRSLALQGAQIICHPANLVLPWCQQAMKVRSLENRVFSITANRIGTEVNGGLSEYFTGLSQILDTKGEIFAEMGIDNEGVATVEIDPQQALDKSISERNDAFGDRKPDFYTL